MAVFEGLARGARIEGSVAIGDGKLPWQAARM